MLSSFSSFFQRQEEKDEEEQHRLLQTIKSEMCTGGLGLENMNFNQAIRRMTSFTTATMSRSLLNDTNTADVARCSTNWYAVTKGAGARIATVTCDEYEAQDCADHQDLPFEAGEVRCLEPSSMPSASPSFSPTYFPTVSSAPTYTPKPTKKGQRPPTVKPTPRPKPPPVKPTPRPKPASRPNPGPTPKPRPLTMPPACKNCICDDSHPDTGFVQLPGSNCEEFVECYQGCVLQGLYCPTGTIFDKNLQICNWKYSASCGRDPPCDWDSTDELVLWAPPDDD